MTESLVQSTVEVYNSLRAELLPTPSKSHYTFNLRDLSKVGWGVQGGGQDAYMHLHRTQSSKTIPGLLPLYPHP